MRELGGDLAELLLLEATDDVGQALYRVTLNVDASVLERLQERLADALLQMP